MHHYITMKTLTLIRALAIGLFCTSFIPYPDDARILCTGNNDCKITHLPNGLIYTAKYAFFHRVHRMYTCAVIGELYNPTKSELSLDRTRFFMRRQDSTRFIMNPFGITDPHDMFEKVRIQPDPFPVKAGQKLDYVFSWRTDTKLALKAYNESIARDTLTFLWQSEKPIALFKIVLAPRKHHGG
ncbi:hypothetical protein [Mucilaginibacter gotjawali]|uniref:Uncharacterized protein n=1 Tax=Mucilaginibacter gotjawali TaxID=1550579 RepID=A0A839SHC7_9SPHI|nr:hypothetical protein [Mucilaginibacter gotjawali]MBB3056694.1 hypothetical protein [Mucilaginibacter gotjawali]